MPVMPDFTDLKGPSRINTGSVARQPDNPIPDAINRAGREIQQQTLANDELNLRLKRKADGERDSLELSAARADWNKRRLEEEDKYQNEVTPDTSKWESDYDTQIKEHKSASSKLITDPKVRQQFELEADNDIATGGLRVKNRKRDLEMGAKRAAGFSSIDDNLALATKPGLPKEESDKIVGQTRASIDNMVATGVLTPEQGIEARQKFVKGYATLKAQQDVIDNPEAAYQMLQGGSEGSYLAKLRAQENASESNTARPTNPDGTIASSALGRYQITDGTWSQLRKRHPDLKLRADGRTDPNQQEIAIRALTADNAQELRSNGFRATEANLYLAHFMGSGGAVKMLRSNGNASAAELFPDAAKANPTIFYKGRGKGEARTVSEVIALQTKGFSGQEASVPDYYKFLDAGDRMKLSTSAESDIFKKKTEEYKASALEKYQYKSAVENDVAQMEETGQGTDLSPETVASVLGEDDAAKWLQDRQYASDSFKVKTVIDAMPTAQINVSIEQLKPKAGAQDFAGQQKIYESAQKYAEKTIKAREDDPAGYVLEKSPHVQEAWKGYDPAKPETAAPAIAATMDAQKQLGITPEKIMPMPKEQAGLAATRIGDSTLPVDDRIQTLVGVVNLTTDPAQKEQIVRQLAKQGLSPKMANVVDAYSRGDVGAARRLFQAATIDPDKAPKLGNKEITLDKSIEDAMLGDGTVGEVFYGLEFGDPQNAEAAKSDMELAKSAARLAMAGGMDQAAAIKQATSDIFGKVTRIDDHFSGQDLSGQVSGVIEEGVDKEFLLNGLYSVTRETINDALAGYSARAVALTGKLEPADKKLLDANTGHYQNSLLATGIWRNLGDEWGFFIPQDGAFLAGGDGKPLTFSTQAILEKGKTRTKQLADENLKVLQARQRRFNPNGAPPKPWEWPKWLFPERGK